MTPEQKRALDEVLAAISAGRHWGPDLVAAREALDRLVAQMIEAGRAEQRGADAALITDLAEGMNPGVRPAVALLASAIRGERL